jgi:hypothetical protein
VEEAESPEAGATSIGSTGASGIDLLGAALALDGAAAEKQIAVQAG